MARTPGLAEIIRRAIDARLLDVRTSIAGVIVSYDAGTRRAKVLPAIRRQVTDSDSAPTVQTPKALEDVPVLFPGSATFELVWDLAPGDPVRLEYSEEDDAPFYDKPGAVPLNPQVLRRFGGNVVCRPEGMRGPAPIPKFTAIHSDGTKVLLGDEFGLHSIPSSELFIAQLGTLVSAASAAAVAGDGGVTALNTLATALQALALAPAPVSLLKVKGT